MYNSVYMCIIYGQKVIFSDCTTAETSTILSVRSIRTNGSCQFWLPLVTIGQEFLCLNVSEQQKMAVHIVLESLPLLYSSSSRVSVAYSALGDSTMASTGQDSWQKPQ